MSITQSLFVRVQLWYNPERGETPNNVPGTTYPTYRDYKDVQQRSIQNAYHFTKQQRANTNDHWVVLDYTDYSGPLHIANSKFAGDQYAEYSTPLLKQADYVSVLAQDSIHNIDTQVPENSRVSEKFWMDFAGYLIPPVSGTYTFGLHGDNATLIAINGKPKLNTLGGYSNAYSTEGNTFTMDMVAGQFYELEIL